MQPELVAQSEALESHDVLQCELQIQPLDLDALDAVAGGALEGAMW
jgi:hypothetical protein